MHKRFCAYIHLHLTPFDKPRPMLLAFTEYEMERTMLVRIKVQNIIKAISIRSHNLFMGARTPSLTIEMLCCGKALITCCFYEEDID